MVRPRDLASGPYWQHLRMRLDDGEPPRVLMDIDPMIIQVYGKVHGGAIAGLADSAIAVAINSALPPDKGAATVELKLNFLKPVAGGILVGEGKVLSLGKNLVVGQGEIRDETGELVAVALATYRIIDMA